MFKKYASQINEKYFYFFISTIIQIEALLYPSFTWNDRLCAKSQRFWVIVEDSDANIILHHEIFVLLKKTVS